MKVFLFSLVFIFSFSVSAIDPTEKQNIVPESKVTKSPVAAAFSDLSYVGDIFLATGTGAIFAGYIMNNDALMEAGGRMIAFGGGLRGGLKCAAAFQNKK